jgi:hypothetical protein
MQLLAIAALASALAPASAYLITGDTVNCRSGPGTNYGVKKTYSKGTDVKITCQTSGTNVEGNSIWDKTSDGCYVADYYVKTGSNGYVTDKCGGTSTCVVPKSNQATVDLIAEFEGFVDHVCTCNFARLLRLEAVHSPAIFRHRRRRLPHGRLRPPVQGLQVLRRQVQDPSLQGRRQEAAGRRHEGTHFLFVPSPFPSPSPLSPHHPSHTTNPNDWKQRFEKCITAMTKATVNLNQYGALVSWSFNMGCGAAETSTLIKRLNKGENVNTVLSEELPKWVHAGGKVLQGLVRRRNAEIALAKKATNDKALPAKGC